MEIFISLTRRHGRMCIRIYIFNFKKQTYNQKNKNTKKGKEAKGEKRISPKSDKNKQIFGRPGEDFSRHPHFL